ncbi:MAG TPA: cellulase family glycosylhydrolase [bacterium]|nr:cellulase family glycosylhydrolase [bacterium]
MNVLAFSVVGLLFVFVSVRCHGLEYGINNGAPISASTGAISPANDGQILMDTGTEWVRVNFILGPWSSPGDATPRGPQNLSWFETYDQIIDGMLAKGLKVYGLIGAEAVPNSRRDRLNTEEYAQEYAAVFQQIVDHFKGRIKVYESFNEPNDWAGGTVSQVEPRWFARYLELIYRAVKMDGERKNDPVLQEIVLVSGPLFTHLNDLGREYFSATWKAGTTQWGWDEVKSQTGSYPLDGVGIHIYVAQGEESDEELVALMKRNLDAMYQSLTELEGADVSKRFYLSEFGWTTKHVSEQMQAHKMDVAFRLLELDSRMAQAHWFTLQDFPDGEYGIYRAGALTPENRKPSYEMFRSHATGLNRARPPMNAILCR